MMFKEQYIRNRDGTEEEELNGYERFRNGGFILKENKLKNGLQ